ncbi:UNVERIFIED_CONTAM: D-2-hydroxyglutarate--pyruvate transhydrogenase DLD2 [Trichonephila clavipes]
MQDIVTGLEELLGPEVVTRAGDVPEAYRHDWSGLTPVEPLALLRPRDTAGVSAALRFCNEHGVGVVPQGGRSGISGGAMPVAGAVVLSLDRLNQIEEVDPQMATLTCGAGVVLEKAQQAAAEAGLMLAVDLGARGSCTVGGVISTNAGGNQVIRYGMAREHVLGLEVVLADGTVVTALNKMLKNNAGLDLKQMFIGTEGLLGVVTRAVMRLQPRPPHTATAFLGLADTAAVIDMLARARAALGPQLTSFEVMWPSFFHHMSEGTGIGSPLTGRHGVYVVIEASGFAEGSARAALEACLEAALEAGTVEDAVIAANSREERGLWAVRESVAEFARVVGPIIAFDVGIPLMRMDEAVRRCESGIAARWPGALALSYGHIGDSNLHLVVSVPSAGKNQPETEVKKLVYGIVREMAGTISAEHGIGLIKRDYLAYSRSPEEIATMRAIKAALDPKGILNPGKVLSS